jgi:hypothetical protein
LNPGTSLIIATSSGVKGLKQLLTVKSVILKSYPFYSLNLFNIYIAPHSLAASTEGVSLQTSAHPANLKCPFKFVAK